MPPRIPFPPITASVAAATRPSPHTHCRKCLTRALSNTTQSLAPPRRGGDDIVLPGKGDPPPKGSAMIKAHLEAGGRWGMYRRKTRLRRHFELWLNTTGAAFRDPVKTDGPTLKPNYLSGLGAQGEKPEEGEEEEGGVDTEKQKESEDGGDEGKSEDSIALERAAQDDSKGGGGRTDARKKKDEPIDPTGRAFMPFPLNPHFISQSIPSESLRHEVWRRVQVEGKTVRQVSVELGVEMRRVGAIVRLMELERKMTAEGQNLAIPYQKAIHSMVPVTPFDATTGKVTPHESINDLPVNTVTAPQIFYPTSESRQFNRVDAGRVFSAAPRLPDSQDVGQGGRPRREPWQDFELEYIGKKGYAQPVLKAADARIPHPHLIAFEKDRLDPELKDEADLRNERYYQRLADDEARRKRNREEKEERAEAMRTRVDTERWQFVVTDVQASREGTGLDGRGTGSVGLRYGVPHRDRKRGEHKIPAEVDT